MIKFGGKTLIKSEVDRYGKSNWCEISDGRENLFF